MGEPQFDSQPLPGRERAASAADRSLAIVLRNLFREESALLSIGRFQILRTLGRGGTGTVYEAFDPLRGGRVALKILHGRGPTQLYRLKREFRALAALRHPNLVALHELSVAHDDPFFTMDLIEGADFVAHVSASAPGDARSRDARLRDALRQLCEGVHALHAAGKLHCDIKPSNVLVEPSGRVVLLDFGLVHDARDGRRGAAEGTPAYMAPEQARGAACEASDWYSFGLVLRDALAGSEGPSPALEALASRLADPDPARRPVWSEVAAIVGGSEASDVGPRSAAAKRAPFVGRSAELHRLEQTLACGRRGPCLALVRGEAGSGKSALLTEFERTALLPSNALVLSGQCYEREAVPYKALDSIIDELSRHLLGISAESAARFQVPDRAALLHVFPVLGRVAWLRGGAVPVDVHPVELRARAFAALKQIFAQLASERTLVLRIEDLQWSDADSGRLLGSLLCDEDSPAMLVLASDRTDTRLRSPTIEELRAVSDLAPRPLAVVEIELSVLLPEEARTLAAQLLDGALAAPSTAQVAADSRGNPLLLTELARFALEARARFATETARGTAQELPSIESLLRRRIGPLSAGSRRVLELLAVAGRPLSAAALVRAAHLPAGYAEFEALRAARLAHAIVRGGAELFVLDHDRIGEVVLDGVGASQRRILHARLAAALELERDEHPELLVEQYVGAGMPGEAARCARGAADQALASLAFARAAQLYQRALELAAWSAREQAELERCHALALEHSGRTLAAASAYARAARATGDPFAAAQLEQRAGELRMHNGAHREGERELRRGYARLGLWWPEGRVALALAIAGLLLPGAIRRLFARGASDALRRARAQFLSGAGRGMQNYDLLRAIYNALLCFDQSERLPDPVWHARASGARGIMWSCLLGPFGVARGLRQLERACARAAELGDVSAQGDLQTQLAFAHLFTGRSRAALEAASRSEACLRSLPLNQLALYPVMSCIGSALFDLGRLREARQRWIAFAHEARLHGDLMTTTWIHAHPLQLGLLFAASDRERADALLQKLARVRADHPRYRGLVWAHAASRAEHALYFEGDATALELLRRDRRELFLSGYVILTHAARMIRARARIAAAAQLPPGFARSRLLIGAWTDARALRRYGRSVNEGASLLIEAGVAFLRGRPARARAKAAAAAVRFEAAEAKLYAATAAYCAGFLEGGERGRAERDAAARVLSEEGVRDPARWAAWSSGIRQLLDGTDERSR